MSTQKPTLIFTCNAKFENDFWLLDNNADLAVIPKGAIRGIDKPMPIRLAHGNAMYGSTHILARHGPWVKQHQPDGCVATFVHQKLSQRGRAHATEHDSKINLNLSINPSGLMVLKNFDTYFSVTTIYFFNRRMQGVILGPYHGHIWGARVNKGIQIIPLDSVSESILNSSIVEAKFA